MPTTIRCFLVYPFLLSFYLVMGNPVYGQSGSPSLIGYQGDENLSELHLKPGDDPRKKIGRSIFITVSTSKKTCHVGECVLVTFRLLSKLPSESRVLSQPAFEGCSVIEMTTDDLHKKQDTINGSIFNAFVIRQVQLMPLQEGNLSIGKITVGNTLVFLLDSAGRDYPVTKTIQMESLPFELKVLPLPKDSSGLSPTIGVGQFFFHVETERALDTVNGMNELKLTISGKGNFGNIKCPTIEWPSNILRYDEEISENLDKLQFPIFGQKKFLVPFTCLAAGKAVIPSISFQYFDPESGRLEKVTSDTIQIKVVPIGPEAVPESVEQPSPFSFPFDYGILASVSALLLSSIGWLLWRSKRRKHASAADNQAGEPTNGTEGSIFPKYRLNLAIDQLRKSDEVSGAGLEIKNICLETQAFLRSDAETLLFEEIIKACDAEIYGRIPLDKAGSLTMLSQLVNGIDG